MNSKPNIRTMLNRFRREAMESDYLYNRVHFQIEGNRIKCIVAKFADVNEIDLRLQSVMPEFPTYETQREFHDSFIYVQPRISR